MDLEIIKDNKSYLLSDYDVHVQDIRVSSIPLITNRQEIDGFPGSLDYGSYYGDRPITVDFYIKARDDHDFPHLRDLLFELLVDKKPYFIREVRTTGEYVDDKYCNQKKIESYVNGKQYHVSVNNTIDLDQVMKVGFGTIEYLTSGLPFAESIYTTKELNDSGYSILANEFITNEDRKRFENLEIGGRNLLRDTALTHSGLGAWANLSRVYIDDIYPYVLQNYGWGVRQIIPLLPAGTYTISTLVKASRDTKAKMRWSMTENNVAKALAKTDEWQKISHAFTTDKDIENFSIYFLNGDHTEGNEWLKMTHFKLEKGNKATDWTPATEDFKTNDDYIMYFVEKGNFILKNGGLFGLVDSIHDEHQKYKFTERNFTLWNAGNVTVEPETMYLKITVTGTNGKLEIKNKTTGQTFKINATFGGTLIIDGVNVQLNGVNVFRDTNKRYISLVSGRNEFEVIGQFTDMTIDFRYYYK